MPYFKFYDFDKHYTTMQGMDYGGLPEPKCKHLEADFLRCAANIGWTRAAKECDLELADFRECVTSAKKTERMKTIIKHRDQLVKEGKYTPPGKK